MKKRYAPAEHLGAFPEVITSDMLALLDANLHSIGSEAIPLRSEKGAKQTCMLADALKIPNSARPDLESTLDFLRGVRKLIEKKLAIQALGIKPGGFVMADSRRRQVRTIGKNCDVYLEGSFGGWSPCFLKKAAAPGE